MRYAPLAFFALSSVPLLTQSAPFQPKDGLLQRNRRRAVDYPLQSNDPQTGKPKQKRSVNYSVVQVDGGSSSSSSPSTVIQTVTDSASAAPASTTTLVYTSVIQGSQSQETVVVTTTQELSETVTADALPASVTVTSTSVSEAADSPQQSVATEENTNTVYATITTTMSQATAPATTVSPTSSMSYYDDGQWHTYYPVKNFVPPPMADSTPTLKQARDVRATIQAHVPGAALPSEWAWKQHMKKRSTAGSAYGPYTASFGASYATPAVRARAPGVAQPSGYNYIKRSSNDTEQQVPRPVIRLPSLTEQPVVETEYLLKRDVGVAQPTSSVSAYGKQVVGAAQPSGSYVYGRRAVVPGVAQPTAWAGTSRFQPRKLPADLKLASWNITGATHGYRMS